MKTIKFRKYCLVRWIQIASAYIVAACCLMCFSAEAKVTNSISSWLKDGTINWGTWGVETNELCAGLVITPKASNDSALSLVSIYVLTSKTNALWDFLTPPSGKFSRLELRDASGVIVSPKWFGKKIVEDLPQVIKRENLPKDERHGVFENVFILVAGQPSRFSDFNIEDVYSIKNEGDYTLTVCVALYQFSPDRQFANRIDLPCVSAKIHLAPP